MSNVNDRYTDQESRFARAFSHGGTLCSAECACGRIHFVSAEGHGDYEDGELEQLQESARKQPDRYVEHHTFDTIDTCEWAGGIIPQCPCGKVEKMAQWIDDHATELSAYLKLYFEQRQKDAERAVKEADNHLRNLVSLNFDDPQPARESPLRKPDMIVTVDRVQYPVAKVVIPATGDHPALLGYMVGYDDGNTTLSISPEEAVKAWQKRVMADTAVVA